MFDAIAIVPAARYSALPAQCDFRFKDGSYARVQLGNHMKVLATFDDSPMKKLEPSDIRYKRIRRRLYDAQRRLAA